MKEFFKFIMWAWVLGTSGYVLFDLWNDYKVRGIEAAYRQGSYDTAEKIVTHILENPCVSLPVSAGENSVNIVDKKCLPDAVDTVSGN
ncbi:MAG TPA: hypothetical protein PKA31_04020 [Candidatus Moranbacteria bacterium]|nr:hypothetical protein [Candidatus Moranbacteria bacterium]